MKLRFTAAMLLVLAGSAPSGAAALTRQDLEKDMSYYRRVSEKNGLGANDRLYILYRLKAKYADGGLDLSRLDDEVLRWEQAKSTGQSPAPGYVPVPSAQDPEPQGPPGLTGVRFENKQGVFRVVLQLTAPVVPQAFRADDAQHPEGPYLIVDLPDAQDRLGEAERNKSWDSGPLTGFSVVPREAGGLRAKVEMRGDRPYKVVRAGKNIIVEVESGAQPEAKEDRPAAASGKSDESYEFQIGDVVDIQVSPARELSRELVVQPDGTIVFPLVGTVQAEGMTLSGLEGTLVQKLKPFVTKPRVSITIKQFSARSVLVMGRVLQPGSVPYRHGLKLLNAVSIAGGFAEDAARNAIRVFRGRGGEQKMITVNAAEILASGDFSKDFSLQAGDIVEIPRGGNFVSVLGQVMKPGTFPYREGFTMLELISEAGGVPLGAKTSKARIFRQDNPNSHRQVLPVNLKEIMGGHPEKDVALKPGDIVIIPQRGFYSGATVISGVLTPWITIITLVVTLIVASG